MSDLSSANETELNYEQQRQRNILRNQQQLATLNIQKLPLQTNNKRKSTGSNAIKRKPVHALEPTRRSSRVAGIQASETNDIINTIKELQDVVYERIARKSGSIYADDICSKWAYDTDEDAINESNQIIDIYKSFNSLSLHNTRNNDTVKSESNMANKRRSVNTIKHESTDINSNASHPYCTSHAPPSAQWFNIANKLTLHVPPYKLLRKRIMGLQYHPNSTSDNSLLACCDRNGAIALINHNSINNASIQSRYDIHLGLPTTEILFQPFTNQLYSCSQHGDIRALDLETKQFTESYLHTVDSDVYAITCMTFNPTGTTLYCADKHGLFVTIDPRAGIDQQSKHVQLHDKKIATLSFNPYDSNYFCSGSNDRSMCIWDIRKCNKPSDKLYEYEHDMAVTGVQWSHTGKYLASSSYDCYVRVFKTSDTAYTTQSTEYTMTDPKKWMGDPLSTVHNNRTGRWVTAFKPVWLHNDAGIVIGNMTRAVDLLLFDGKNDTTTQSKLKQSQSIGLPVPSLVEVRNDNVTSIPATNAVHPTSTQIASMTASGYIMFWSPPAANNTNKIKIEK